MKINSVASNNFQPAIGFSFTHTQKTSTFIEYYNDIAINSDTQKSRVVDAGIAYLLTPSIQLDFNAGFSLDQYSSDFMGVGVAIRF
ncbi:MAG: transporter [Gammaproteobacteria bacterium]|nr:transporter [Gammaproteobacteria bacterium]